ncbi:MAG: TlyA family RNA methyltransferase [bacterium]
MKRQRLDKHLVENDLARSRSHAKELIQDRRILIDGFPAEKPSTLVEHNDNVEVKGDLYDWVGRGGRKIWEFIERDWVTPSDRVCLDVGASTGGFTQALLRAEAQKVYAVDVGYGQLDYSLRRDERVTVMDRYNFRHATPGDFDPSPTLFTMDVSFISTLKLIEALNSVTTEESTGLVLLKPQFEAGPDENEQGIVTDPEVVSRVLVEVLEGWQEKNWGVQNLEAVPLKGQEGNQEYMALITRGKESCLASEEIERISREGMNQT